MSRKKINKCIDFSFLNCYTIDSRGKEIPCQKMANFPKNETEVSFMKITKVKKGRYLVADSRFAGRVVIEYDNETRMWYAYDLITGQSVVDCEKTLREIKESISL